MTLTRKGWNSLKPITAPEQMPAPIHWNPMSDDWKRWIDSHQVYNGESSNVPASDARNPCSVLPSV